MSPPTSPSTPRAGAAHPGYAISQKFRKRVEESFGWLKTVGLMRKLRHRGTDRVDWVFVFSTAIYNLVRLHVDDRREAPENGPARKRSGGLHGLIELR